VLVIATIGATSMTACSSHDDSSRTLTLYSGQDKATTVLLVDAFERKTGFKVKIRSDDEAVLANDLAQPGTSDPADVFYSENTPALRLLELHRLLAPVARTTLAKRDPRWQSTSGTWVGVSARVYVMDYNTEKLQPDALPTSVMDLGSTDWQGRIGIAPRDTDFQSVVSSILRTHGEDRTVEWLEAIKANAGSYVYSDNGVLADAINRGQVELGVVNQHTWFRERAKVGASHISSAVAFLRPQNAGYHLDISGAAVLRSSHAPAAAQQLVAFLASRDAAEILTRSKSYEYPLAPNVEAAEGLAEFNSLSPVPLSFNDLGDGRRAIELLRQANLL
jgi:iron(III) transport system substrate-binding protein